MRSRQKIIDATLRVVQRDGFGAVTIAAVAHEAQVSRQTVYTIFSSREQLVSQALAETTVAALAEIREQISRYDDAGDIIIELIVAGRSAVRTHPALTAMIRADSGNPLFETDMIASAKAVVIGFLPPSVTEDPALAPALDDLGEIVTRLAISVVFFGSPAIEADDELRAFLRRWLLPALTTLRQQDGVAAAPV